MDLAEIYLIDAKELKRYNVSRQVEVKIMAEKISVYLDHDLHRALKAEATLRGKSLSEFMVDAAVNALYSPRREKAAARMDRIRESSTGCYSSDDIRSMRDEGRSND